MVLFRVELKKHRCFGISMLEMFSKIDVFHVFYPTYRCIGCIAIQCQYCQFGIFQARSTIFEYAIPYKICELLIT